MKNHGKGLVTLGNIPVCAESAVLIFWVDTSHLCIVNYYIVLNARRVYLLDKAVGLASQDSPLVVPWLGLSI